MSGCGCAQCAGLRSRPSPLAGLQRHPRGLAGLGATAGTVTDAAGYAQALQQAFKGDTSGGAYSAAIVYAGAIAAIGNAIASYFNKSGDIKSAATSALMDTLQAQGLMKQVSARPPVYLLPNLCKVVRPDDYARAVSEAIRTNQSPEVVAIAFKRWVDSGTNWQGGGCIVPPPAVVVAPAPTPAPTPTPTPTPAPAPAPTPSPVPVPSGNKKMATSVEQQQKAASVSGSGASLLSSYSSVAGTVPGRLLGVSKMEQIIAAIGQAGKWPNVKKWGDAVVDQVVMTGCKGCTPPTMIDWVRGKVAAGQNNPVTLVNDWTSLVNSTWGSKWLVASAGDLQRQALIDTLDALIAQVSPDAPLYYAQPTAATPVPAVPSGQIPGGTPGIPIAVSPTPTPTPTPTPAPVPLPVPVPAPTSAVDPNLQAYVKALMDQGASQQQAFQAAMSALQNAGVPPTPQVQQAVAGEVQAASSPTQASVIYLAIGAAAIIGLGVVMSGRKRRR